MCEASDEQANHDRSASSLLESYIIHAVKRIAQGKGIISHWDVDLQKPMRILCRIFV